MDVYIKEQSVFISNFENEKGLISMFHKMQMSININNQFKNFFFLKLQPKKNKKKKILNFESFFFLIIHI
jgi:hypothetical protein